MYEKLFLFNRLARRHPHNASSVDRISPAGAVSQTFNTIPLPLLVKLKDEYAEDL
jgi:hypothetical protein